MRVARKGLLLGLFFTPMLAQLSAAAEETNPWWRVDATGGYTVNLYFFWTDTCPHCQAARPDIAVLPQEMPWLAVVSKQLARDNDHTRHYSELARSVGERAQSVPAFLFCGRMLTGYDTPDGMGAELRRSLRACHQQLTSGQNPLEHEHPVNDAEEQLQLPLIGDVDLSSWSLPAVTIALGLLDSINPCAFFVLLFLLSLLVNVHSRARMMWVGALFVTVSGVVYFLFLAAWLALFVSVGEHRWITLAAGIVAVLMGALNVKDFFTPQSGVSLSMSTESKQRLFRRMRSLVGADRFPVILLGTLTLALFANAYEVLCTAGLPMVFTRLLTLHDLPTPSYYAYLALYCAVYVTPLLIIVGVFTITMGRRKLAEHEGRLLKMMSGLMMLGLGLMLLVNPAFLNNIGGMLLLLAGAVILTYCGNLVVRRSGVD